MTIESWIAYIVALSLLGLSPGPAWAAVITTGIARGFPRAAAMALGIALGDVVFLVIAGFLAGYAALAARSRRFFAEGKQGAFARRLLGRVLGTTLIGTGVAVATR